MELQKQFNDMCLVRSTGIQEKSEVQLTRPVHFAVGTLKEWVKLARAVLMPFAALILILGFFFLMTDEALPHLPPLTTHH